MVESASVVVAHMRESAHDDRIAVVQIYLQAIAGLAFRRIEHRRGAELQKGDVDYAIAVFVESNIDGLSVSSVVPDRVLSSLRTADHRRSSGSNHEFLHVFFFFLLPLRLRFGTSPAPLALELPS